MLETEFLPSPVDTLPCADPARTRDRSRAGIRARQKLARAWRPRGGTSPHLQSTAPRRQDRLDLPKLRPALLQAHPRREPHIHGSGAAVRPQQRMPPRRRCQIADRRGSRRLRACVVAAGNARGAPPKKRSSSSDLCRSKARLTARSQWASSHRSATLSSRRSTRNMSTPRLQPRAEAPRTTSHRSGEHWIPIAAATCGTVAPGDE
jgi:hypothetical protein